MTSTSSHFPVGLGKSLSRSTCKLSPNIFDKELCCEHRGCVCYAAEFEGVGLLQLASIFFLIERVAVSLGLDSQLKSGDLSYRSTITTLTHTTDDSCVGYKMQFHKTQSIQLR